MTLEWDDTQAIAGAPLLPGERVAASLPHPEFTAVQWLLDTWTRLDPPLVLILSGQ